MDDGGLSKSDDLLLRLMDRYKPHLKPYAYRLQTWEQVLEEYNAQTGNRYRQIRTLKKKFEKLRDIHGGREDRMEVGNLELLHRLIRESRQQVSARSQIQLRKAYQATTSAISSETSREEKVRQQFTGSLKEGTVQGDDCDDDCPSSNNASRESSGGNQPPPLDSITIGFPHSYAEHHSESKVSSVSSPSQPSMISSSYNSESLPRSNLEALRKNLSIDPIKINTPSAKGSPADEPNINTRVLNNLIALINNHHSHEKQPISSTSSPLSIPHNVNKGQSSGLTLEKFYNEFQQFRQSQEEFRSEVLYRLDIISGGIAECLNLSRQYETPNHLGSSVPGGEYRHETKEETNNDPDLSLG